MILNKIAKIVSNKKKILPCDKPLLIAHRGCPCYNTFEYRKKKPINYDIWESSKSAYRRAIGHNVKAIELDVHLTKDNELIVIHDKTLNRTTNARGEISEYTMKDLETVFTNKNNKENLPTLKWMFDEFSDKVIYIIEIKKIKDKNKTSFLIRKLVDLIKEYKLENNCSIISFYPKPLITLKKIATNLSTGLLIYTKNYISNLLMNFAFALNVDTISFNYDGLNETIIKSCRSSGFKIGAWTVNTKENMNYMKKLKIDYITTDFLDLL